MLVFLWAAQRVITINPVQHSNFVSFSETGLSKNDWHFDNHSLLSR